jgi:hypothetical protein
MFLLKLLFVIPAAVATLWTVATAIVGWTTPLKRKLPYVFWGHPMMLLLNYENSYLYSRPGWRRVTTFMLLGIVPVVSALLVAWMVYQLIMPPILDAQLRKDDPVRYAQLQRLDAMREAREG